MSTYNIGFYEDLTKFIFELSSDIFKYASYFFCWLHSGMEAVNKVCNLTALAHHIGGSIKSRASGIKTI